MSDRRFLPRLEKKYTGLTVETIAEDGSFSGYASLFGEVDLGKDAIQAGAFLKSIQTRGAAGTDMADRDARLVAIALDWCAASGGRSTGRNRNRFPRIPWIGQRQVQPIRYSMRRVGT